MGRFLLLALLGGCITGMGYSTVDQVTAAAREYNEDARWGRYEQAAAHLPTAERQRFIDRRSSLDAELEFADYEMVGLEVDGKKQRATARVDYSWSLKQRGILEKTSTKQSWERQDGHWVLAHEVRLRGAPLVLFDEPPTARSAP